MEEKLEDWNIEIINGLMSVKGIESEQFDFKKDIHTTDKSDKFSNHICAMANSSGGYIVVGIEEKKAPMAQF
jgi:predicted HTH transcriptional regulator